MAKKLHNNTRNHPHCPELDTIMGNKQSIIGKWALPIMLAMAAIAALVFVYAYAHIISIK